MTEQERCNEDQGFATVIDQPLDGPALSSGWGGALIGPVGEVLGRGQNVSAVGVRNAENAASVQAVRRNYRLNSRRGPLGDD